MTVKGNTYEVAAVPALNPDGSTSLIEVFRDITERERLMEQIIQAKVKIEALNQSEKMKTELLAIVSHDLRTPLSIIKGYTETVLHRYKDLPEHELVDLLTDIDAETRYLNRLVGNLLDMARIESGSLQLNRDWYQVSEILEGVNTSLNALTKERRLAKNIPEPLPPVFIDRVYIGEVLINLCENAVKYSAKGKQITIEAKLDTGSIIMSVIDEGPGITAEDREKIFQRFYRINQFDTSQTGIGLGLPICVGIIEKHGGKIWVESSPGVGSKFSFNLPLKDT